MIIKFNKEISEQEIYANGDELARIMGLDKDEKGNRVYTHPKEKMLHVVTFKNPILVTDNYRIGNLEPSLRDTLFALYGSPIRITEYDNTSLEFEQKRYPGVWGPSIDTLLFCRALDKADFKTQKKAIEIGSGSGFVSKYILEHTPSLESLTLIDLNKYALECAQENIKDRRAKFFTGDGIEFIQGKKYDAIICNPPYIPRPKSIDDNPYEGVGLLGYLISHAPQLLTNNGVLITNISSLCKGITKKMINESNVEVKTLDSMEVPLKVYNVLNNKEWMDYLLERGLQKNRHDGYDYWHTIAITELKRK
jgi:tRNA1(Val) A37 N6-methylase TrmN6